MRNYRTVTCPALLTILAAGCLMIPTAMKAADSAEVTNLLADAKAEAVELKADSDDLVTFTKSELTWESYFDKVEMIKGHVNNSGKLLAKLKDAEATASPWQQKAIRQIEPLLREMADNTTATIKHLNERKAYVHFPAFQNFVKANFELATDLEALTRDFVNYGNAKEKSESLGSQLEIGR